MFASGRLSPAEALETRPRLVVESIRELGALLLDMRRRLEIGEEGLRRQRLHHPAGGRPHRRIRRDDADALTVAVLARQPLDDRIGMLREANFQGPRVSSLPDPSNTSTPRAPRAATQLASVSRSSNRFAKPPACRRLCPSNR